MSSSAWVLKGDPRFVSEDPGSVITVVLVYSSVGSSPNPGLGLLRGMTFLSGAERSAGIGA